jgi:predicted nucleic acid-binding protein
MHLIFWGIWGIIKGWGWIMRKLKIYLDTSAISYLRQPDTPEKTAETLEFWDILKSRNDLDVIISKIVIEEIICCRADKVEFLLEKMAEIEYTTKEETDESKLLLNEYIKYKILPVKSLDDLRHISIAVTNDCDYIVSWNFKHFVNLKTINSVNYVNTINNYHEVKIYSPFHMLGGF